MAQLLLRVPDIALFEHAPPFLYFAIMKVPRFLVCRRWSSRWSRSGRCRLLLLAISADASITFIPSDGWLCPNYERVATKVEK